MKSLLIHTTPQLKSLYSLKRYEGNSFPLPFHRHHRYELTYIVKGSGTRLIGDSIREYSSGDIVLIAPYLSHQWQTHWVEQSPVSAISLFFEPDFPTPDFQLLAEFKPIATLLEAAQQGIELQDTLRNRIAKRLVKLPTESGLLQMIGILSMLEEIARSKEYYVLLDGAFTVTKNFDGERIAKLVEYVRAHITEKIYIRDLADLACMHPGSVTRFFKQSTGFALKEYINLMRIGRACQMLTETNKPVYDVSQACGFDNLSHFNRLFKRVKHHTPQEYRKQFG